MLARRYGFWLLPAFAAVILAAVGIRALTHGPNGDATGSNEQTPSSERYTEPTDPTFSSAYYTFTLKFQPGLAPKADRQGAGGSLAAFGDGFLLVSAAGDFYRLSWEPGTSLLRSDKLPLSVPFNVDAFVKAAGADVADRFRILDLLVDERGGANRVYVAHHYWDSQANCITLRVSSAVLPAAGQSPDPATGWRTLFDSRPCMTVGTLWPNGSGSLFSGGRLALHDLGLLLTVGDHGFDGNDALAFPQKADVSYGKIMLLDMRGGAVPFSIGHRNPQGLLIDSQRRLWSTEQGPQGGDELNLIVRGGNYGWPLATYGTDYDSDVWPLAPTARNHGKFREPALAFVPSVALSQLIQVGSKYLPRWSGDLLLGSLRAGRLFRVRLTGDRVIYTEPIEFSVRFRDLAEGTDGRILILDDDGQVAPLLLAPPQE